MSRGGIEKPIGYETIWRDREGRIRVKVKVDPKKREKYGKTDRNMIDKRVVVYLDTHKKETFEDLKGYVIMHLDNNPLNFDKKNLVKVKKEVFLLMLNNRMLFNDSELNKIAILTAQNMYETKRKMKLYEK